MYCLNKKSLITRKINKSQLCVNRSTITKVALIWETVLTYYPTNRINMLRKYTHTY